MNTNNNLNTSNLNTDTIANNNRAIDVKLSCKREKRRFGISPLLPFRELLSTVRSLLNLDPHQPLLLRYVDREGDKVTLSSDFELRHAVDKQLDRTGVLKLKVSKDKTTASSAAPTTGVVVPVVNTLSTSHSSESSDDKKKRAKRQEKKEKKDKKEEKKKKDKKEERKDKKKHKKDSSSSSSSSSSDSEKDKKKKEKKDHKQKKHHHGKKHDHYNRWEEVNSNSNSNCKENDLEKKKTDKCVKWGMKKNEKCHKKDKALFARFVQHVTIEDQTVLPPNFPFTKTWRMRNEGTEAWPVNTEFVFIGRNKGSELMGAPQVTKLTREVLPGQEIDISVPMVSPSQPGMYFGYYRLFHPVTSKKFGQRVWVQIHVKSNDQQTTAGQ